MILPILFFTVLHLGFCIYFNVKWKRIRNTEQATELCFSVIVPVRNEQDNIDNLLTSLSLQEYPIEKFEVIVVDDFSNDQTVTTVSETLKGLGIDARLVSLQDTERAGKKYAITMGVEQAKFDYILTTDADCKMGSDWIRSYADSFGSNKMMAGPVAMKGDSWFDRLQKVEFAGLIGFGAVTIGDNNASMCSGANLGFLKKAFLEVKGYENNIHIPSGDDEFLLYEIMKAFPYQAEFIKDKRCIVTTPTHNSLGKFWNQRTRWTSKWKHNRNWKLRSTAILFFLDYLLVILLILGAIFDVVSGFSVAILLILRFAADCFFLIPLNQFINNKSFLVPILTLQIIYPIHVLLMGVQSIFGGYTWKGRRY